MQADIPTSLRDFLRRRCGLDWVRAGRECERESVNGERAELGFRHFTLRGHSCRTTAAANQKERHVVLEVCLQVRSCLRAACISFIRFYVDTVVL